MTALLLLHYCLLSMEIDISVYLNPQLATVAPGVHVLKNCFMQHRINAIFTKRDLELNGRLSSMTATG